MITIEFSQKNFKNMQNITLVNKNKNDQLL